MPVHRSSAAGTWDTHGFCLCITQLGCNPPSTVQLHPKPLPPRPTSPCDFGVGESCQTPRGAQKHLTDRLGVHFPCKVKAISLQQAEGSWRSCQPPTHQVLGSGREAYPHFARRCRILAPLVL